MSLARYAVTKLGEDGRVLEFVEKPEEPASTLVATCIYAMPYWALRMVEDYLEEGGERDAPGHFIEWLCRRVDVYGYILGGGGSTSARSKPTRGLDSRTRGGEVGCVPYRHSFPTEVGGFLALVFVKAL